MLTKKLSQEEKRNLAYEWFVDPEARSIRDYCEATKTTCRGFMRKACDELNLLPLRKQRGEDGTVDEEVKNKLSTFSPKAVKEVTPEEAEKNKKMLKEFLEEGNDDIPLAQFFKTRNAPHLIPLARKLRLKGKRQRCASNPILQQKVWRDIDAACDPAAVTLEKAEADKKVLVEFLDDDDDGNTPLGVFFRQRHATHLIPVARRKLHLKEKRQRCRTNPSLRDKIIQDIEAACRPNATASLAPTPSDMPLSDPHTAKAFLIEWFDQPDNLSLVAFYKQKKDLPMSDLKALRHIAKSAKLFRLRQSRHEEEMRLKAMKKLNELFEPYLHDAPEDTATASKANHPATDANNNSNITLPTLLKEWFTHPNQNISPTKFLQKQKQLSHKVEMKRCIRQYRLFKLRAKRNDPKMYALAMKRINSTQKDSSGTTTKVVCGITISPQDTTLVQMYLREWFCDFRRSSMEQFLKKKDRMDLMPVMKRLKEKLELRELREEHYKICQMVNMRIDSVFPEEKKKKGGKKGVLEDTEPNVEVMEEEGDFVIAADLSTEEEEEKEACSLENVDTPMDVDDDDDDDDDDVGNSDEADSEEEEGFVSVASASVVTNHA